MTGYDMPQTTPPEPPVPPGGTFRTFADLADHLCGYHPPQEPATADALGDIRAAFDVLIDIVAVHITPGPDATIAARRIHDACQGCIAAVILNQPRIPRATDTLRNAT